jgi:hypothetical protein
MMNQQLRRSILPAAAMVAIISGVYLQAYVDSGRRWSTTPVSYYVNPESKYLSPDLAINAIRTAADAWNQAGANIELRYAGTTSGASLTMNNKNELFFRDGENGSYAAETYSWWDSSNRYKDSDIVFYEKSYKYFSVSGCSQGVYAENVAAHEFGHMLGLRHSTAPDATMEATMSSWCDLSWTTLAADDISGIRAMYPPTATTPSNTVPTVQITSPSNGSSHAEGASISFTGTAQDTEQGSLTSQLAWSSNLSGHIGTGGSFSRSLPAGTHTITARVTDSGNLTGSRQINVTVAVSTSAPIEPSAPGGGAQLSARGYKVKGQQKVDLKWSGLTATSVEVFRSGSRIMTTGNSGAVTDNINKNGGGSYRYKVCAAGTTTCSNEVVVTF